MRLVILIMSALFAAGVVVTTFVAIWSTRRASTISTAFRMSLPEELVWAAIPCLMVLAAAIPAVAAVVLTRTGD